MARLPKVWEQREAERIWQEHGDRLLDRSVLRVVCNDCGGRTILWAAWVRARAVDDGPPQWRPVALERAKNDRLTGRRTDRGFDFGWLDRAQFAWPSCKTGRYRLDIADLAGQMPPPTSKKVVRVRVCHSEVVASSV